MGNALQGVSISRATPCSARWAEMEGDERSRHCASCERRVYNVIELSSEELNELIREHEGNGGPCVRVFIRRDGSAITADCPRGVARRVLLWTAAAIGLTWLIGWLATRRSPDAGPFVGNYF